MNFKIGDTVLCIDISYSPNSCPVPLKKQEYNVYGVQRCACGAVEIDVGFQNTHPSGLFRCADCGRESSNSIWWFRAKRFVKAISYHATANSHEVLRDTVELFQRKEVNN